MSWLARMFTVPRADRERLAAVPGVHLLAQELQSLAIASAQSVIDAHVSDPAMAERIKAGISEEVRHAIPIPLHSAAAGDNARSAHPEGTRKPSAGDKPPPYDVPGPTGSLLARLDPLGVVPAPAAPLRPAAPFLVAPGLPVPPAPSSNSGG